MNELINLATVNGVYNNLETEIQSNITTTILINNLLITKKANKQTWATGNLIYTITITNPTSGSFQNVIIYDILNSNLVLLIPESVRINGIPIGYDNLVYDKNTGLLSIALSSILANETITITFEVKKTNVEIFKYDNFATLLFDNNIAISNNVTVYALSSICGCKENSYYK